MGLVKKLIGVTGVLFLVCLLLISTPPKAVSFDMGDGRLVYDDGAVRVFALPGPEGSPESNGQAEVGPTAVKAKVKILTCHATTPPLVPYDTYPWIKVGESMAHYAWLEVLGVSDDINIVFTVTGPQWSKPYVHKTDWIVSVAPGEYYMEWRPGTVGGDGSDFYTTEGYYKLTVKGIPKGNKLNGASSDTSWFHIKPAAPTP